MEEKERKEKLKAGKEKLAQFQKKKKKKKQKPDSSSDPQPTRTSELTVGGQVLGISTQSGAEFIYDSDNQTTSSCSEDDSEANEEPTSKQFVKLRSKLQQKHDRVEELEELLVGKQLALDKVLKENTELQSSTKPAKQSSIEQKSLVSKVTEAGDHQKDLDEEGVDQNVPQSPRIDPAEVQDLIQQVQWLQLQLKQAGSTLHTQNERQTLTVNALQKAKSEILELQQNVIQKDNIVTELAKKLKTVCHDYTQLRENQESQSDAGRNKEKGLKDEIQNLQQDKMAVEETVKTLEDKLTAALKEKEDLQTINKTNESERDRMQKSHESFMSDSENKIYDLQEKNSTLQEKNSTLQEENSTLQEKNSTLQEKNSTLQEENGTLHKDREILSDIEAKLQAEINALNEKVEHFETQKIGSDEHVRNLLAENERLLDANKSLSSEVVNLKEDNTMYQSQMGDYEDKISQAEELLEDNRSLRVQNDDLNNKINNQKDVIAALKGSISALTSENVKLMEQFENVSSSYSLQKAEIEGVKSERDDLLLLCEERRKALEDSQAEAEHYKALSMSLEDEVASLKLKLSSAELASEIILKEKGDFQQDLTKQLTIFDKEEHVMISEVFVPQVEEVIQAQSAYKHKAEPNMGDCVHETIECDTVDLLNSLPDVPNAEHVYPNGANVHEYSESESNQTTSTNAEPNDSDRHCDPESQNDKYDDDTAYHSQTTNPCSESNDEQDEQVSDDPSGTMDILQQKTEECELLKTEIQTLQIQIQKLSDGKPISMDLLSDSNTKDRVQEEARTPQSGREVSPVNVSRIGASEMEVNVHASSYPTTQRDGPSKPSSVQTLEFDHVTFQHREGPHLDSTNQDQNWTSENNELDDSSGDTSRIQKESAYLNEIVKQLQLEKTELLELYEQEKSDKQAITEELDKVNKTFFEMKEEHEEISISESKLQTNLIELQSLSETMKSKNDELSAENEKLTWERDELEIRLNSLDSEFLTMKSVKCDLEYKEEQVREELIQVKERLEYLESCDKDIFEMKEMVEKLQEDKDTMIKENEVLQCSLAAKTDENDRVCKHMDVITKENGNMKSRNQELEQEVSQFNSDIRALKHDMENNQKEYEKIVEERDSQEERFIGEIEGLEHENSTLKTKVKSYETELELQKSEMQRLSNFFSNVDSQIEEIGLLKHRNSEIETKFEEISKENEDLVNELLNCHKKIEALQYEKEELCSKCDELQNIIDDMDDEKTSLLEITENLKCELDLKVKNKDCVIEKYEMQLDGLDNENATLKTQVSSLKQDLQEVLEQSQTLDEDHIQQSEEISVLKSEKEKLKEDAKCTQTKVTKLEEDLLELVNQVQLYDNTLSEKMDLATRLDQQVKGLLNENEELREKCGSLEHDLDELKTQESYLNEQLKIYEENISNNQNRTDELSRVQQQLELETKYKVKAQGDCETMHTECYKLSKENSQLQSELNSVRKDYDKLLVSRNQDSELINEMKDKIKSAESERDEILLEHQSVSNNVTEVADENEALRSEIEKLNVNLSAISENRNHIRNQVEVLSAEIESLATERDSLAQENGRLLDEIDAVRSSESNLKDNFVRLSDKYQSIMKYSEDLDHQNKKLQEQNDEIRLQTIDFQDKLSKLEEAMDDNSNAQGVIESLDKKLADLKCCVDNLRDEKRHLESVIEDLTSMLHDMQIKYEEVKSEMESTKKKCDKEISQLQSHLQVMNDDVTELRKVLDVMENEMYNVNEEKQTLKENFEQQQAELVQAVEAKENLLKKFSDKQQKDLKNMKMVDKLNQEKQDMSQLCETPSSDDMNALISNDTVNVETNSLCNETGVNESEHNICEDQIVPSFERIFEFFPLSDQSSVSCHVQTNISIGEFERTGTLLDDNGECVEIAKDSFNNVYTQTEPNDLDEEHSSDEVEHEHLPSDLSCRHSLEINTTTINALDISDYRSHQVTQTDLADLTDNTESAVNSIACQCDTITPVDNVDLQEVYVGESNANSVLNSDNVVLNDTRDTISVTSEDSGLYQTHSNHQTENNVQNNDLVRIEIACQTDIDFKEEFGDEVQLEIKEKCSDLDFREKKVQGLEDNYERKINQMEYELEEKYEHKFRDKVAEIAVQAEKDKKKHASEIETEAKRQIERVKVEKDQQFVVALQQARADLSSKKKGRRSSTRRGMSQGSPKDMEAATENADVTTEQGNDQDVNQLRQDNEELAQARDDLLQKINITQLEQDVFRDQLYSIMGEHQMLGDQQHPQQSPNQQAALMTPSLLDWELSPELSFDSVRSSLDTKSLSGSLDPSSFCSNSDCLSVRMKYEHLIERIQQFLKIKTQDQSATSLKESQSFELESGASLNESNSGNKDKFIEHSEPDDQVLQRVTSIHLEHWAKSKNQQDEDGSDVKDTFVEESGQQDDVVMDNIIQEIITESQARPVSSTEFLKTPVYHRQTSRKKSRKRFALTFQSTPSDTDRSPEGINDANVSPFSHCTASVSTMEEGHFSEDEQDGLSFTTTVKKRHYSDGDIQLNDEIDSIKTSQSDNFEGHFVIEKTSVPQKSRAVSLPPESQEKSEMENLNDNVFTNTDIVTEKKRTKDSKRKKVNIDGENVFVAEESRDIKVPSIVLTKLLKTDSMSGKDSGDFFEESLTSADDNERIDSGDILEKIGNEIVIDETGDNRKANNDTTDGVFQEESSPKPEADFIKETEIQREQSFSVEASVNLNPSKEVRTSEFDNARFDVLNAICPGTDPSRNPEFRNDKNHSERREDGDRKGDKISEEKFSAIDLQEKVNELEGVITILESQKTEAKEKIESLDQKLREITSPDNQNTYIQQLEQELRVLRRQQAEFDQSLENPNKDMLLQENRKLTELMKESERLADERNKELLSVKEEIGLLKKRNNELEELKKDQERLKEEINQLSLFKENLVQELDQEKAVKMNIEKENTEIEDALIKQADVYDNLNEKHVLLQQELQSISETKDAEIQKLQDASLDLSSQLQRISESKDAEILKLQDASSELSSKLQKESDEIVTVQKSLESAQEEIHKLVEERERLKVAIQNNQTLLVEQEKNVMEVTKNSDELKQTIKDLQESAETADQQLNDKELKLRESLSEKENLVSKVETLQQELTGLRDKINKQQEVIDEHENLNNSLQTNKEKQENILQDEIRALKKQLDTDNQIKLEHEWAIKEFASQIEILEKEKQTYNDTIKQLESKMRSHIEILEKEKQTYSDTIKHLETKMSDVNNTVEVRDREIQALRSEYDAVKERLDTSDTKSDCSNTDQQILEDLKETLKLLQDEKVSMEKQYKDDKAILMDENYTLSEDLKKLQEENAALEKSLKSQEDTLKKENTDILKMYSDLRNEVEVLVISKHDLEIELVALKNLLEHGDPSLVKLPQETGRELTLQDLEDLDELKTSIEQLKSEMKEKDDYVRKLEEHLLGAERGLPSLTSTPKPQTSKGEPAMSKAYRQRKLLQIGKRAFSHDLPIVSVPEETNEEPTVSKQDDDSGQDTPLHESDLDQSNVSEKLFTQRLAMKDSAFTSSQQSDRQSLASSCSSLDSSKIRSGLKPEEDGHLALELKQFELVDEISNLKRDFRETKALYAQETALLSEALEKEKAYKEYLESGRGRTASDPSGKQNFVVDFPKDVVRLRQDVAVLKEENKLLKLENERWIRKIKEQEKIVFDLKDRLLRNTSGIEEIEEVFGRQLALLQKQREELFDKLKAREDENHKLSATIGEKGVLEESLRREKEILISKLNEKTDVENELKEKQETLVVLQTKHKEMEDIIYQKDLNERELMKQKRLLEEELHEIESKFKDREENLGYEKNQLLDELRVKKDSKPSVSESDLDDTRSACSDSSSYSDRHIASLELTLVDVEKQHAEAVRVLREQLKSKYSRRERALRRDHRENLEKLHNSAKEQVT